MRKINVLIPTTKSEISRNGLKDVWNAYMVKNAKFSINDIPFCPTTSKSIPTKLISYKDAKTIHNKEMVKGNKNYKEEAFIHFWIDDQDFDGPRNSLWLFPKTALKIIKHFAGVITPDFSTYADFPDPLKRFNTYRMRAFGYWLTTMNIQVINNVRWNTAETWSYCFDGIPENSIVAIGSVASQIKYKKYRSVFEKGLLRMVEVLRPKTIILYGSDRLECIDKLRQQGLQIITFKSDTNIAFQRSKNHV